MAGQPGFFDVEERLKQLSAKGDALERLSAPPAQGALSGVAALDA
jgi:hypothetical protein